MKHLKIFEDFDSERHIQSPIYKIDTTKPVKLRNPEEGEENLIFKIVNYNKGTRRCYIEPINSNLSIPPQELVSIDDVKNV